MTAITIPRSRILHAEQITCTDPQHCHNSPIQNMISLDVNGHFVEVTQDGHTYNVRIDDGMAVFGLLFTELNQFIMENT